LKSTEGIQSVFFAVWQQESIQTRQKYGISKTFMPLGRSVRGLTGEREHELVNVVAAVRLSQQQQKADLSGYFSTKKKKAAPRRQNKHEEMDSTDKQNDYSSLD
jgi:hypothetical protein